MAAVISSVSGSQIEPSARWVMEKLEGGRVPGGGFMCSCTFWDLSGGNRNGFDHLSDQNCACLAASSADSSATLRTALFGLNARSTRRVMALMVAD